MRTSVNRFNPKHGRRDRAGLSLIEILISMFVLLFGLMGVAAIFPVGNHYAIRGEQADRGATMSQTAFEELRARGMLRPELWVYADASPPQGANSTAWPSPVIRPFNDIPAKAGLFNIEMTSVSDPHPGHAYVIDPMGVGEVFTPGYAEDPALAAFFPFGAGAGGNPWQSATIQLWGSSWPIRRVTFATPDADNAGNFLPMPKTVANSIFSLRDDVSVELPDQLDRPGIQRWDAFQGNAVARAYKGNYSWLATVVPTTQTAVAGLQPSHNEYGNRFYDVSVAVFHSRVATPSEANERLVWATLTIGGEVQLYIDGNTSESRLDEALDELRSGNWIALAGVNSANGAFLLKWYKLLSLDDDSQLNNFKGEPTEGQVVRRAMIDGPDWPVTQQQATLGYVDGLHGIILPGVIGVSTRPLKMEEF